MKMTKSEAGKLGAIATRKTLARQKAKRITIYNIDPKKCNNIKCDNNLSYYQGMGGGKYCSRKCSKIQNDKKAVDAWTKVCLLENCQIKISPARIYCSRNHYDLGKIVARKNRVQELAYTNKASSGQIKEYLLNTLGDICQELNCAWNFQKQPIKCELEHIDGNSENNSLENCTLLCPNCHSLTPTYKAKNKGNGRHSRRLRYQEGKSY